MLAQLTALIATLYALIDELRETIAQQRHQLEQLQRAIFSQSAEKMPSVKRQLNNKRKSEETADQRRQRLLASKKRRKQNAAKKRDGAREEVVEHPIADCDCAECAGSEATE